MITPSKWSPVIVTLLMVVGTYFATARFSFVSLQPSPLEKFELPDKLGDWSAGRMYFCHNQKCLREYESLQPIAICPACGSKVFSDWSLAEKNQLPPGTELTRRRYHKISGEEVLVTFVLGGIEQVALHRPQICLAGQGFDIGEERTLACRLKDGRFLRLRILRIHRRWRDAGNNTVEWNGILAYWFTDGTHETPYHLVRMFHSAVDRVLGGRAQRWAFVTLTASVSWNDDASVESILELTRHLHPLLVKPATR